jgi:PAS domain S-box-containing protein
MVGTVVDITDRKQLEADLRHHAAELQRILETIGEGFVAFDTEFRCVYVNPPAARKLGRTPVELIGQTPWDMFPDELTRDSRPILEAAVRDGTPRSTKSR